MKIPNLVRTWWIQSEGSVLYVGERISGEELAGGQGALDSFCIHIYGRSLA